MLSLIFKYLERLFKVHVRAFLEREIVRLTLFNNFNLIHSHIHYSFLHVLPIRVLIFGREENRSTRTKTLEAQGRSRLVEAFEYIQHRKCQKSCIHTRGN